MKYLSEFFGHIPDMSLHFLQMITNFLYVCQSISWLTWLLKLGQYRDISSSQWGILLKCFGDISGMLVHYFQIILNLLYICQSVSWPPSLLNLDIYRDISSSG